MSNPSGEGFAYGDHQLDPIKAPLFSAGGVTPLEGTPALAEEIGFRFGTEVSLTAKADALGLRPSPASQFRLADLLAGVTPENILAFVDPSNAGGAEAF